MRRITLLAMMCLMGLMAQAAIVGPYLPDAYTLQLWHLDETALPCLNSIAGGPNMNNIGAPAVLGAASFTGFGNALNNGGGWLAPKAAANDATDNVTMQYAASNGSFTYEAVIRIGFDPAAVQTQNMEILSGDGDTTERLFQFRIVTYTATHTKNELQFQKLAGTVAAVSADIPTAGDDAIAQNGWYHAAVTCDKAGNVKLYWTRMDASRTQANLIGSGTVTVLPAGVTPDLCIGNEGRDTTTPGRTEGFMGLIDEVRMSSTARSATGMMFAAAANPAASNPTPACFAMNVPTSQVFQWTKGVSGDTAQYLYLVGNPVGTTDPNFAGAAAINVTGLSQYTPALTMDKTYFWAISNVIAEPNGTTDAVVWKFSTSLPITTQPVDFVGKDGDIAAFTIAVSAASPAYTWYKTADFSNTTASDDVVVGGNSPVLTLTASTGTEGYYFCKVTGNYTVASNVVRLGVKRKIGKWSLDALVGGKYQDTSGNGNDATPNGTFSPSRFVNGVDVARTGNALNVDPNSAATVGSLDPSKYTKQFSISLWAKWAGRNENSQGLVSKSDLYDTANNMWQLEVQPYVNGNGDDVRLKRAGLTATVSAGVLTIGLWTHIAVTFDGTTATIYRDVNSTVVSGAFSLGDASNAAFRIGSCAELAGGTVGKAAFPFYGAIDEVQVFNYALSQAEIAGLYNEGIVKNFCLGTYGQAYDFDGNCKIDLKDMMKIAENWLGCGLIPASACN